jgi:SurA N-terminal domain/PPIC-type PPIASE domain
MLTNIRNVADTFIMRLLLGMVACAFVFWGIKDVLQGHTNNDLVTFSRAKNITESDFRIARSEEISILQKQSDTYLTEEDLKRLNVDQLVLQRLINDSVLNYIVNYYDLNITDHMVLHTLKQSPIFKNDQGEFDLALFKSIIKNSYHREADYLQAMKEKILRNIVLSSFLKTFKAPDLMVKNIVDYMAEKRYAHLVQIDLTAQAIGDKSIRTKSNEDELKLFYDNHPELFTIAETRSISYVLISQFYIAQKIHITEEELLSFYNENKEEFDNKPFVKVKKHVTNALTEQKSADLIVEFTKNLEDDLAAGAALPEIATKYGLEIKTFKDISYLGLEQNKIIGIAAPAVFEMSEGEISYPIEIPKKHELILVQLNSITPTHAEEFKSITNKVEKLWNEQKIRDLNFKNFEKIAKDYTLNTNTKDLTANITIDRSFSVTRAHLEEDSKLPSDLLMSIFQAQIGTSTPIFTSGNKAYFAYVTNIKIDEAKVKNIEKSSRESIISTIKNSVLEELIGYFIKQNNIKINNNFTQTSE